ncbi:metal-dependent hydrolase [Palaeococcus pacificus DY20341]|uniref:Metal-dependent hydrolase n=1 Tax=Palaeococcus pacificus DY20341 TaxID=1343739 RepID=A0A075LVJ7_9EURY|nr:TatD family hydrolase [Palaeococcus pacificus]AIF70037.1 metal-dependent hydrolase [Palaeococcus pacificus DY20341]
MIILDNHFHVDPYKGLFLEAVKQFHRAGGTHLNVVYKTAHDYGFEGMKAEDFIKAMDFHIKLVEKINKETEVRAFAVVGVHPAEFVYLAEKKGLEYAKSEVMRALEYAQKLCLERKAIAIGEIGRPHYEVSEEVWEASIELMKYGMSLAKEADCAVQLHTESFNEEKFRELGKIVKEVGIKPYRVVKHFSPPLVKVAKEVGVFPSIIASKKNIAEAIKQGNRFMMETDYIDDKRRPGAVLGPKTVPKRTKAFLQNGLFSEEDVYKIHMENPKKVYGVELEE